MILNLLLMILGHVPSPLSEGLQACMQGPEVQHVICGECLLWDYDGDQDVDLADVAELYIEWTSNP